MNNCGLRQADWERYIMLDILKTLPLITDARIMSSSNNIHFQIDDIQGMAKDFSHSICIGLFLLTQINLSDAALQHITLLLASLKNTQDYALQLDEDGWWLWMRCNSDSKTDEMAILIEQLVALNRYLISLIPVAVSLKNDNTGMVVR